MRTIPRTLIALLLSALTAAPALAKMPGRLGIRAGLNLSAFGGEFGDVIEPDPRVAPNLALVYEYPFSPKLALHTEAGWSSKGGKTEFDSSDPFGNSSPVKVEWRFDYLEIPLLMRGRFGSIGAVTPYFELGPALGITLSGKFEDDPHVIGEQDLRDDMKPIDLGWAAGAGVDFPAGPGHLGIEARYTRGFSDLFVLENNFTTINQAWTFALSYTR